MNALFKLSVPALMFAALSTAAPAASHGGDLPASVKARKAHMQLYSHNIGILAGMAKGETEYDADAATAAAANIEALSGLNQSTYWQSGTDSDSLEGTRALPALWENIPDVTAKVETLNAAASSLAATAGDGLDAVKAGLGPLGKACGECHEDYRLSDN